MRRALDRKVDIIIDFIPDAAAEGAATGKFSDVLALDKWQAETPVAEWPALRARLIQLLNIDGDAQGTLSQTDLKGNPSAKTTWGRVGLEEAIRKGVEEKFAAIATTLPGVKLTVSKTDQDSFSILRQSAKDPNDVYVMYVGNERPTTQPDFPKFLGEAQVPPPSHNFEWYGYVYAKRIANDLLKQEVTTSDGSNSWDEHHFVAYMSNAIAHEIGHLMGLGHVLEPRVSSDGKPLLDDEDNPMYRNSTAPAARDAVMSYSMTRWSNTPHFKDYVFDHEVRESLQTGNFTVGKVNARTEVADSLRGIQTTVGGPLPNYFNVPFEEVPPLDALFGSPSRSATTAKLGTAASATASSVASQLATGWAGVRSAALGEFTASITRAASSLPLVSVDLANLLGLQAALSTAVGALDVSGITTMAGLRSRLTGLGFAVEDCRTDAELAGLNASAPADFVQASRTYILGNLRGATALQADALDKLKGVTGLNWSGSLDGSMQLALHLTVGCDSAGFYVLPGLVVDGLTSFTGIIKANGARFAQVEGLASVDVRPQVELRSTAVDGRVRLGELSASALAPTIGGGAAVSLGLSIASPAGPLDFSGRWAWDVGPAGFSLNASSTGISEFVKAGAGLLDGIDSDELAAMIRRIAGPLAAASGIATNDIGKTPSFFGKSFSIEDKLFAFQVNVTKLVNGVADRIGVAPTVSGQALLDRVREILGVDSVVNSSVREKAVRELTFDVNFASEVYNRTIDLPDSFKVGGFTIDTSGLPDDIQVAAAVSGQTRLRIAEEDGLQLFVDADRTDFSFKTDIESKIKLRGKVAKVLDFSGLLEPSFHPEFDVTFSGGEMGLGELLDNVAFVPLPDQSKYFTMPVRIKLDPVDPLPAFEYRTTYQFDLTKIGDSSSEASVEELPGAGVYFRDINVSNGEGPILYELFRRAGGPILEKINNAIPDDVRDVLLGTKRLGDGFGSLTINDVIGAQSGLLDDAIGYDSPLDVVPYAITVVSGVPWKITRPVTDALERILRLSALLDEAKAEWAAQGEAGPPAGQSPSLQKAEKLGLKFPIKDNMISSVVRILSGDPGVPLVTFTYDLAAELLKSLTDGMVSPETVEKGQEEIDKFTKGIDYVNANRVTNDGRLVIDIDTAKIKDAIVDKLARNADGAVKTVLRYLLKEATRDSEFRIKLGLESSITVGVDTHFLRVGSVGQRLVSSIYLDTSKPLFDFEMDAYADLNVMRLLSPRRASFIDDVGAGFSLAGGVSAARIGGVVGKAWNRGKEAVAPAINAVSEGYVETRDRVAAGVEKFGENPIGAIVEEWHRVADQGEQLVNKALAYLPSARLVTAVGGRVTVGVRDGADAGKLRLNEAMDGEAALYARGNLSAQARAVLKGGGTSLSFDTGRRTLLKFDTSRVRHDGTGGVVLGEIAIEPNEFAEIVNKELIVYGSDAADVVEVTAAGGTINVIFNGVTRTYGESAVDRITVSFNGLAKPKGTRIRPTLGKDGGNDSFVISGSVPQRIRVSVAGGSGNDSFTARSGNSEFAGEVAFQGGAGGDRLTGGAGRSSLAGEGGADVLQAGSGYALMDGGDDPDALSGPLEGAGESSAGGIMVGGHGEDLLNVGNLSTGDWILVGGRLDAVGDQSQNMIYGGQGNDLLVAGDLFRVGGVPRPVATSGGKATMLGRAGNDAIYGSPFDDVCVGGDYDNLAFSGVDQIFAGDGVNLITPGNFIQSDDPSILVPIDTNVSGGVGKSEAAVGGKGFDTFRLGVASTAITFRGRTGSDLFDIGTGDVSTITGPVTVIAGAGSADRVVVNDDRTTADADYRLTPTSLNSMVGGGALRKLAAASRFGGLAYDATAEGLDLLGTDGVNVFDVQPSLATSYFIDGNAPASGFVEASKGDYLKLDTKSTFPADPRGYGLDTSGRRLSIEERGKGRWDFTAGTGHKPVSFTSIERFNHVDILAVASEAGATSSAAVRVYDAETLAPLFTIDAAATYGTKYREGVRVATGDLDNDGLPDVAVAPGRMAAPVIKVFNGSPQSGAQGTEIVGLRISADATYGSSFKGGVSITIGDVVGDTLNDIVLAPSRGPATVKVFRNKLVAGAPYAGFIQTPTRTFNAFPGQTGYIGGGTVAAGDVLGLGKQQIVVGSGVGIRGEVNVFDVRAQAATYASLLRIVDPTVPNNRGGVSVTTGDLDGDGRFDIVTGVGAGSGGWVRAYSGRTGSQLYGFQTAANLAATVPTRVAVRALDGDSRMAVFATWGADARQNYRIRRIDSATRATVDQLQVPSQGLSGGGLNIG